jgi:hypothetical protein
VVVTLTGFSEAITGQTPANITFTGNGTWLFTFRDLAGNTGTVTATVTWIDTTPPVVTLNGSWTINVEFGSGYTEFGATRTDNADGTWTISTPTSGSVITWTLGTYTLYYIRTDTAGNTGQAIRTVNVVDTIPPIIILYGSSTVNVQISTAYTELGAYRTDHRSTWTVSIISGTVDTWVLWPYTLTYYYFDGTNTWSTNRTVTVVADATVPVITLNGAATWNLEIYSAYTELGAVWSDNGSTWTVSIIGGTVNTWALWPYTLTYYYSDGTNTWSATRTITVVDTSTPVITLNGASTWTLEIHSAYTELGAVRSDNGSTWAALISGTVNTWVLWPYTLTYYYSDGVNTWTATRTITVVDTSTPVITLSGASTWILEIHSAYTELGAVRSDNGSTWAASISGTVNTWVLWPYTLTYYYSDGVNTWTATRTITVVDTSTPVITLNGASTWTLERNSAYTELGAVWSDNGSTWAALISGTVNTWVVWTYTLTYYHSDGVNTWSATRTITVVDTTAPVLSWAAAVTNLTSQTPSYSFTGSEIGTISYSWILSPSVLLPMRPIHDASSE